MYLFVEKPDFGKTFDLSGPTNYLNITSLKRKLTLNRAQFSVSRNNVPNSTDYIILYFAEQFLQFMLVSTSWNKAYYFRM